MLSSSNNYISKNFIVGRGGEIPVFHRKPNLTSSVVISMAGGLGSVCIWKGKENTSPSLSNQGQEKYHNCCCDKERTGRQDILVPLARGRATLFYVATPEPALVFLCLQSGKYKCIQIIFNASVLISEPRVPVPSQVRAGGRPPHQDVTCSSGCGKDHGQSLLYYWGGGISSQELTPTR